MLDLDVEVRPCPRNGDRWRPEVVQRGGRSQFPFLVDPNTGKARKEWTVRALLACSCAAWLPVHVCSWMLCVAATGFVMHGPASMWTTTTFNQRFHRKQQCTVRQPVANDTVLEACQPVVAC